jgi:hypothetical protein
LNRKSTESNKTKSIESKESSLKAKALRNLSNDLLPKNKYLKTNKNLEIMKKNQNKKIID